MGKSSLTKRQVRSRAPARDEALDRRLVEIVSEIPRGAVATYGQVASLAGAPGAARHVGRFLFHLPEGAGLPWHRVVNSRGEISRAPSRRGSDERQRGLLEREGVHFDVRGRIPLDEYLWRAEEPTSRRRKAK